MKQLRFLRAAAGRLFRMRSISGKIRVLVTIAVLVFTLTTGALTYSRMAAALEAESSVKMSEVLRQVDINIAHSLRECEKEISRFLGQPEIERFAGQLHEESSAESMAHARQSVVTLKQSSGYFVDARLFTYGPQDNVDIVFSTELLGSHQDLYQLQQRPYVWTNVSDQSWNKFAYVPVIYCYAKDPLAGEADNSVWRFDLSAQRIFESVSNANFGSDGTVLVAKPNGSLIFFNRDGEPVKGHKEIIRQIAAAPEGAGYLRMYLNGSEYFVSYNKDSSLGWYLAGIVPRAQVRQGATVLRNYIILLSACLSILLIFVLSLILRMFTRRTEKLSAVIEQFGSGNFSVRFDDGGGMDEISLIGTRFNEMMERIQALMWESEEHYRRENALLSENLTLEVMKKQAELQALQNQINPHFLFNTLEMLKGMFYAEESRDKIINVVQAISDMFRYNLDKSTVVGLGQELNHIRDYMFIQNTRFDEQIAFVANVPQELADIPVLRFAFEPIVENSIKHGFCGLEGKKEICITAERVEHQLILALSDNGCGIEGTRLEQLNEDLRTGSRGTQEAGGIGIFNVNARLQREYGQQYGLRFESAPGAGTTVWMIIPCE